MDFSSVGIPNPENRLSLGKFLEDLVKLEATCTPLYSFFVHGFEPYIVIQPTGDGSKRFGFHERGSMPKVRVGHNGAGGYWADYYFREDGMCECSLQPNHGPGHGTIVPWADARKDILDRVKDIIGEPVRKIEKLRKLIGW